MWVQGTRQKIAHLTLTQPSPKMKPRMLTLAPAGLRAVAIIIPGKKFPDTKVSTICKPRPRLAPVIITVRMFLNALAMVQTLTFSSNTSDFIPVEINVDPRLSHDTG